MSSFRTTPSPAPCGAIRSRVVLVVLLITLPGASQAGGSVEASAGWDWNTSGNWAYAAGTYFIQTTANDTLSKADADSETGNKTALPTAKPSSGVGYAHAAGYLGSATGQMWATPAGAPTRVYAKCASFSVAHCRASDPITLTSDTATDIYLYLDLPENSIVATGFDPDEDWVVRSSAEMDGASIFNLAIDGYQGVVTINLDFEQAGTTVLVDGSQATQAELDAALADGIDPMGTDYSFDHHIEFVFYREVSESTTLGFALGVTTNALKVPLSSSWGGALLVGFLIATGLLGRKALAAR